jgi:uncharacterized protein affecting Mg2+/Co2+ transport
MESPQIEEQKEAPPEIPPEKKIDVEGLISELERAGVSNTQELTGKLEASVQAGRLAQLLGEERTRTRQLEDELRKTSQKPRDDYDVPSTAIDIESTLERTVNRVLSKRDEAAALKQQRLVDTWNTISGDEDYPLVQPIWEEKLKDPKFVFAIQSGIKNPIDEYTKTVRNYYKNITKRAAETISQLRGGGAGGVGTPPHMETGERTGLHSKNLVDGKKGVDTGKVVDNAKDKIKKQGQLGDEEMLDILGTIMSKR